MPTSASFDLRIIKAGSLEPLEPIEVIKNFAKFGWTFIHNGQSSYLPRGNKDDDFSWITTTMKFEKLLEILEEKQQRNELIGVLMTWQDTIIGGDLLLWGSKAIKEKNIYEPIVFNIFSERQIIENIGINKNYLRTDVNWYLERLFPTPDTTDTVVESYTFTEHL